MDSLIFAMNTVLPIILMVAIGYILKRIGLLNLTISKALNKLVFHLFLPVMLFLNIYKIQSFSGIGLGYIVYAAAMLLCVFLLALPAVLLATKAPARRGALLQACFRSNYALVGIPLAQSLFGDAGGSVASLLSAFSVPALNILAVISLSIFREDGEKIKVRKILLDILKNPLIQGVAMGGVALLIRFLFTEWNVEFRLIDLTPIYKVLEYLGSLATPIALLMLGAQFEFSAVHTLKKEIVFGVLARVAAVPAIGLGVAYLFFSSFTGAHFAAFVAMFATPVSVSSVPMTQEMGGDTVLAGQLVVWTTILSTFSIFLCAFLLRLAGIF